MNVSIYYALNSKELHDRILTDEITKTNESRRQQEEFVNKNNAFHS